jgi:putative phosphoribosyl transferase
MRGIPPPVEWIDPEGMRFRDRRDAGRRLAERLRHHRAADGALVLGLARGGVPVAYEVAFSLDLPLDVFIVRKLGVPGHEELAIGAIATGGTRVIEEQVVAGLELDEQTIAAIAASEQRELEQRERRYRGGRPKQPTEGKTVLLVDDGLATGASMRAALQALRGEGASKLVVAVPIAPAQTCDRLRGDADEVICAATPESFYSVGSWYEDFTQTCDQEVEELLRRAAARAWSDQGGGAE